MKAWRQLFVLGLATLAGGASHGAGDAAENVVVLVNGRSPDSSAIAAHYADRRGIPEANIIELPMPTEETIDVGTYVQSIHNPLLDALLEADWISGVRDSSIDAVGRRRLSVAVHSISYLVTTRGVPLRIGNSPGLLESGASNLPKQFQVNRGSVDSELALLAASPNTPMAAFVRNPLFAGAGRKGPDASRVIRVSRLDGPDRASVMDLIDRTLEAEREGLRGRAYFDTGGPHKKGDRWFNAAGDLAESAHFETTFETTKRPMDYRDRLDAPAIYMGWYRRHAYGPWKDPGWAIPPGAIGYHLHSFSATTVRSADKGWPGPLVRQGWCATVGNVYEPYLEFTHRPDLLLEALLDGAAFGEAVTRSQRALSWMGVAIGDPLYRPFAVGLGQQLEGEREGPFAGYADLREIRRLRAAGDTGAALAHAKKAFVEKPSLALAYRLARLHQGRGDTRAAREALRFIRYIGQYPKDERVLIRKIADLLHELGDTELALTIYKKLLDQPFLAKPLRISLYEGGASVARAADESGLAGTWSLEADRLRQPPKQNGGN
mgnify:CR=1 FL=1